MSFAGNVQGLRATPPRASGPRRVAARAMMGGAKVEIPPEYKKVSEGEWRQNQAPSGPPLPREGGERGCSVAHQPPCARAERADVPLSRSSRGGDVSFAPSLVARDPGIPRIAPTRPQLAPLPLVPEGRGGGRPGEEQGARADPPTPPPRPQLTPQGDLVCIKVASAEAKTTGGIILPDSVKKRPTSGDVVGVGNGNTGGKPYKMTLKEGDTVLYGRFGIGVTDVTLGEDQFVLIREQDCIGVMPTSGAHASDIPKMTPIGDRILVKISEEKGVTMGGVLLPDAAKEKPVFGQVVACGPGSEEDPMEVEVGETVVYFKYAGDPLETPDGQKWVVLRQNDVLCKA